MSERCETSDEKASQNNNNKLSDACVTRCRNMADPGADPADQNIETVVAAVAEESRFAPISRTVAVRGWLSADEEIIFQLSLFS